MFDYRPKTMTVQEIAGCTCDRCGRLMTPDDPDDFEFFEKLSVSYWGGFGSIFGDGSMVSIDLCQHCVKEALGAWLRVTPAGDELELIQLVNERENQSTARRFGALAGNVSMSPDFDAPLKIDEATPATNIVTLGIDSERAVTARFAAAMKGEAQGSFITFASPELLFQTLTQPRWHIVKAMTGVGPLSLREVALHVGRDVEAVHDDVRALLETGVLERTAEGAIVFPYDAVHVDFMLLAG